jgi:UDP-2,4-diacetamido-2,4,6-trideoxy-beta-L-altropyranose hydrolase
MQIVFRTDASVQIGTGHVMRCLTLADTLRLEGAECTFICRDHVGHLIDLVRQRGHHAVLLTASRSHLADACHDTLAHAAWLGTDWASDADESKRIIGSRTVDWLVVDHYALDHRWEKAMRPLCHKLMVIDDLADRVHDCDLLLDQNLGRTTEDYRPLVPHYATTLIGPRFALLRPEFAALREDSLAQRKQPQLQHLLITLGGVDKDNLTGEVLQTLRICNLPTHLRITVVMGPHAPWLPNVQAIAAVMPRPTQVLVNVNHMARLMTDSDLVIGAAGGTAWERCSLGLPSLVFTAAQNQRNGALALQKNGAAYLIESTRDIAALIENPLLSGNQPAWLQSLSTAAAAITDGNGSTLVLQELKHAYV